MSEEIVEVTKEDLLNQIKIYQHLLYLEKSNNIKVREINMVIIHIVSIILMWLSVTAGESFHWIAYLCFFFHTLTVGLNMYGTYIINLVLNYDQLVFIKINHDCCFLKYHRVIIYAVVTNIISILALFRIDSQLGWIYCIMLTLNAIASLLTVMKLNEIKIEIED